MMSSAEREEVQHHVPLLVNLELEHESEPSGRSGQINLGAARQDRAVATVLVDATQLRDGHSTPAFEVAPGLCGSVATRLACARQILLPSDLVKARRKTRSARWHAAQLSPSGGTICEPWSRSNSAHSSAVGSRVPVRSRIASIEVSGSSVNTPSGRLSLMT
jgi:hypothetical protein